MANKISKKQMSIVAALLILATFAAYQGVRNNAFINFDDDIYVTDNQIVTEGLTLNGILWAFGFNERGYWQPLTWLSHMLDCELYGLNPTGHHITSLMIHLANVLLLFWTLCRMTGRVYSSAFAAAFFALHPLNVDSVAWVAERKNLLSTFFLMIGFLAYSRYAEKPSVGRYLVTIIVFILGLMAKPMLVTFPFVLLLLDFWPLRRLKFETPQKFMKKEQQPPAQKKPDFNIGILCLEKVPFLVLALGAVWLSVSSLQHYDNMVTMDKVPMMLRINNALVSYIGYIGKMLWPFHLSVYYPFPASIPAWQTVLAVFLLSAITGTCLLRMNRQPFLVFGWFWYLGTLLPVLGIVQSGLWPKMADRWAYVPLIGLFIMIAWGITDGVKKRLYAKPIMAVVSVVLLAGLIFVTKTQLLHWKNSRTLFEHALRVTSENAVAHNNLGTALLEEGQPVKALYHFEEALRFEPKYAAAHNNIGNALTASDRTDEAIEHYLNSINIDPLNAETHNNLAVALNEQDRMDESILHLHEALRLNPVYADAYNNLGAVYRKKAQLRKAAKCYLEAIRLRPDFVQAYNNLGLLLWNEGRLDDAIHYFNRAVQYNHDFIPAKDNLAKVRAVRDVFREKVAEVQSQLMQRPDDPALFLKLGDLYKDQGYLSDSIKQYHAALSISPDFLPAKEKLALLFARKGEYDEAIILLKQLIQQQPQNIKICYYIAGVYARKNEVEDSIYWLKTAIDKGYNNWNEIKSDKNFDNLRENSYFKSLFPER